MSAVPVNAHPRKCSIIIVGVGSNDFDRMNILDGDARDCVGGCTANAIAMLAIATAVAQLPQQVRLLRQ